MTTTTTPPSSSDSHWILYALYLVLSSQALFLILRSAYSIRLFALQDYGIVIHEFDPYFNYRATEYLYENGWNSFKTWFDYMVWYPLGRPVGTTIYPGMQVTAVAIKQFLLRGWSINDICCFIPAWFGVIATVGTALLCYECMNSAEFNTVLNDIPIISWLYNRTVVPLISIIKKILVQVTGGTFGFAGKTNPAMECALFTAGIMSIVPAHTMRSVGGGYDNESVATTAMVFTFWSWTKSLQKNASSSSENIVWGVLTGVFYFYMVAAWGGYVFCVNLIGVHAAILVLLGRYSTRLHRAYTAFYIVGTTLAIQVPVVGWTPLKSLEQIGPLAVFGGMQLLEFCDVIRKRRNLNRREAWKLRFFVFGLGLVVASIVVYFLSNMSYFGPISARVRGLFVKHTRTGNPLVDSVAEHQAASAGAYFQYLADVCYIAPVGFLLVALVRFNDQSSFLLVYAAATYYFSHRMVRLILLTAPIASVLGGVALGHAWVWWMGSILGDGERPSLVSILQMESAQNDNDDKQEQQDTAVKKTDNIVARIVRFAMGAVMAYLAMPYFVDFYEKSFTVAKHLSHPSIIHKAQIRGSGQDVMVDDYREAYWWLRDNTPEDARIMAWWDYGYQITAMANRTTIADGNTWNHEHIALLGRALTSPERDGHRIARHLADYVLLWTGGGGDDLAKSPHLARIANSVYRHMCPGDPTCRSFGLTHEGHPTPKMAASLLYKLHSHKLVAGVEADRNRFKEVYKSKYGKVRIFKIMSVSKESKAWVADPANRLCDAPGSWYCPGQYPPALQKILKEKQDFRQLEDFNVDREHDAEYQQKYMENLNNPKKAAEEAMKGEQKKIKKLSQTEIDHINSQWDDNEITTRIWELISRNDIKIMKELLSEAPGVAHIRSSDGRGPMWWAHEFGRTEIIKLLKRLGVSETIGDADGITPLELSSAE